MSDDEFEAEVVKRVGMDRRTFVRRLLLGSAFAVPVVASFDLSTLTMASADAMTANGSSGRTKLVATGAIVEVSGSSATLEFYNLSATLTSVTPKAPLPGQTITFSAAGHLLGSATTGPDGTASLSVSANIAALQAIVLAQGYTAHFAGTATLKSSSASAGLVERS
jgi:hypothetical protein